MNDKPKWQKEMVAEDEISTLWKKTARPENSQQFVEAVTESQSDEFWKRIEALACECDEILRQQGFPDAAEMVLHDGAGNWWRRSEDTPAKPAAGERWLFTSGSAIAQEFAPDFSDPWYAGRLGKQCRDALKHRGQPNASTPFLLAKVWAIATLNTDWIWRGAQKPSITTGNKQRKVLAEHRGAANSSKREAVEARRTAITGLIDETRLTGGALEAHLQKKLQEFFEIEASLRTIRRDLKELLRQ